VEPWILVQQTSGQNARHICPLRLSGGETAGRSTSSTPSEVRPLRVELTDWLDGVVRRAKEKYLEQRVQEEKLIEEEALKSRVGSQFCRELFEWLEGIDVRFNSRFGVHVLSVSVVGTDGDRSLQVLARPVRAKRELRF